MSKLVWDKVGERRYETGLDHGVLYPMVDGAYPKGVAWNGLTAVNESPSGAEANPFYADNIKYLNLISAEDFSATIEAYTYPDEWEECDGSAEVAPGVIIGQQSRKPFGFSYRTKIGNDTDGQNHGYKLHMVYNGMASPSERNRQTINESPEPSNLSWEVTTTPINVTGYSPTAHLIIDSTKTDPRKMKMLEDILYGTADVEPRMPLPDEIIELMTSPLPTEVTVTATDSGTSRYNKNASELQENITISDTKITGKLLYVDSYSDFSTDESKQKGNFLALDLTATNQGKIMTQLIGGSGEPKEVTDGFCVYRITNPKTQKVSVTVSKDTYSDTTVYDLSGLTCAVQGG